MALNLLSPTIFTTSVLVADTVHTTGGSTDSIPTLTMVGGQPVSAALELQATDAAFLPTRLTTAQRDDLSNPTNGMLIYNTDAGVFEFYSGGVWTDFSAGSGDVDGPAGSTADNIAIFSDTTGKLLADSGVSITQVTEPTFASRMFPLRAPAPLVNVNDIGNIGILTFVDPGFISITGGNPLSNYVSVGFFIDSTTNLTTTLFVDSTATLDPTSISALVELSSTTGALLVSRMTTTQKNALTATDGMILYDNTANAFNLHENGNWVPLVTAGGLPWTTVSGATPMAPNNGYIPNASVTFTLPTLAGIGDEFRVAGNIGLWIIAQNAGQTIQFGNIYTTSGVGGSLVATNHGDCIELVCIVANTTFAVISSMGNITVN